MDHLLEDDPELMPRREREVTLSTAAILGIFFSLVLVCGLFFAFGYNLGRKSTPTPAVIAANPAAETAAAGSDASRFEHFNKPAAGSPSASAPASAPPPDADKPSAPAPDASATAAHPAAAAPAEQPATSPTKPAATPAKAPPAAAPAPPAAAPASAIPEGTFVVQVAAISHREDADLLLGALRARGYTVAARTEPQDKLFHIQVGPFASRKDADAMRQRLQADGYNAIVK